MTAPSVGSWEVLAVRYGTLSTTKSGVFYRYGSYGEPDEPQQMDYFYWVLRGAGRTIVVDTGFDPDVGQRRGRTNVVTVRESLGRLGIDPLAVDDVLLTHFHYDHIGNVDLFPNARLSLAADELAFYTSPLARREQIREHVEDAEIAVITAAQREGRVDALDGTAEIAPGVSARVVGGHAPGQVVVTVATSGGDVVLASDAVHLYEEIDRDRPFSVLVDLPGMYATFDLLHELERGGATVVPGHDPDVTARFPSLDGELEGLAYRLG